MVGVLLTGLGWRMVDDAYAAQLRRSGPSGGESSREREAMFASMSWPSDLPFALAIERARARDQLALTFFFRRYLPVVYRYTASRVGNQHAAEDITSETFLAVVEGISRARAEDELSFSAWILGIARNKVLHHFRRLRAHPETSLGIESEHAELEVLALQTKPDEADPLGIVTARESVAEVIEALHHLSDEQQDVVLYRCVLGYATNDVARLLDKQPAAIRQIQHRALSALARSLGLGERGRAIAQNLPRRGGERERGTYAP